MMVTMESTLTCTVMLFSSAITGQNGYIPGQRSTNYNPRAKLGLRAKLGPRTVPNWTARRALRKWSRSMTQYEVFIGSTVQRYWRDM